jgi:hypothetical protein
MRVAIWAQVRSDTQQVCFWTVARWVVECMSTALVISGITGETVVLVAQVLETSLLIWRVARVLLPAGFTLWGLVKLIGKVLKRFQKHTPLYEGFAL